MTEITVSWKRRDECTKYFRAIYKDFKYAYVDSRE